MPGLSEIIPTIVTKIHQRRDILWDYLNYPETFFDLTHVVNRFIGGVAVVEEVENVGEGVAAENVGAVVDEGVGAEIVGEGLGEGAGVVVGEIVGEVVGECLGEVVGEGEDVGRGLGEVVGRGLGEVVGRGLGEVVGEGEAVSGEEVGEGEGEVVGEIVEMGEVGEQAGIFTIPGFPLARATQAGVMITENVGVPGAGNGGQERRQTEGPTGNGRAGGDRGAGGAVGVRGGRVPRVGNREFLHILRYSFGPRLSLVMVRHDQFPDIHPDEFPSWDSLGQRIRPLYQQLNPNVNLAELEQLPGNHVPPINEVTILNCWPGAVAIFGRFGRIPGQTTLTFGMLNYTHNQYINVRHGINCVIILELYADPVAAA